MATLGMCGRGRLEVKIGCQECPLWVKSGHWSTSASCPLYPQKQTLRSAAGMSALCQKQTYAVQQAAGYEITLSALASSDSGTVMPSAFAVSRLMISSNLLGCSTGMSPGLVPRRILSTMSAACRNRLA